MSQKRVRKIKKQIAEVNLVTEKNNYVEVSIIRTIVDNWKFLVSLCIGIVVLYLNSLNGAFVSDDYATITQNPFIDSFSWAFKGSFVSMSNYFIYKLFGFSNPFPYHLFSLIVYLMVILLVYVFIMVLTNDKYISCLTTILFAVNPVHVESVSWISGKPYLISAITVLISMILLINYLRSANKRNFWPLLISIGICFFSEKVRFFGFVLLGLVYLFSFDWKGKNKISFTKIILIVLGIVGILSIIIYPAVMERVNAVNSGINASGSLFYDPFFQYPTSIAKYLQIMMFPFDLTLYHTMYIFPVWLNWAILFSFLSLIIFYWFKNRTIFYSLIFIFLATAPSMAPIKVSWMVAERYVFLGTLGMSLYLSYLFVSLSKVFKLIPMALLVSVIIVFVIRSWTRNIDWQSNHNLWVNTCQVSPNSHNAWNNIGDDYDKLKDYDNAVKGFTQSTIVKPNYADAFHNRANIFFKVGRLDLARESYQTALKYTPELYQTYLSLTQVELMDKKPEAAIANAIMATKVQPGNPQSWYVLGVVQAQVGRIEDSKLSMSRSLQIDPNYKPAIDALVQLRSRT